MKEKSLKDEKEIKSIAEYKKRLTFSLFEDIYNKYLEKLSLKEHRLKILIKDKDAIIFNSNKVPELCERVLRLSVITDNFEAVSKLSEKLFEDCGAFLHIKEKDKLNAEDVIFDVDERILRIKSDIFINEILFEESIASDFDIEIFEWAEILEKAGKILKFEKVCGNKAYFKFN